MMPEHDNRGKNAVVNAAGNRFRPKSLGRSFEPVLMERLTVCAFEAMGICPLDSLWHSSAMLGVCAASTKPGTR